MVGMGGMGRMGRVGRIGRMGAMAWLAVELGCGAAAPMDGRATATGTGGDGTDEATGDESGSDGDGEDESGGTSGGAEDDTSSSTGAEGCSADQCEIDGVCVDAGTPGPERECLRCVPEIDPSTWVEDPDDPCEPSYWDDVDRQVAVTPYGHLTAIACHNCYDDTLEGTLADLHAAQEAGADLLELDLTDEGGQIIVEHDDGGGADGPVLADVLMDAALQAGDQILNIELKESAPTEAFITGVLDAVIAAGCVGPGRPLMLRAFVNDSRLENLLIAQTLLRSAPYAEIAPYVRLHALLNASDGATPALLVSRIDENVERGFHSIEFALGTPGLLTGIRYAESLGLGTSVWTVPTNGELHVAALRDEVDSITTEYPVGSARARVEADNGLFFLDATEQDAAATAIDWMTGDAESVTSSAVAQRGLPLLLFGDPGDPLLGTSLSFVASEARSLPVADLALAGEGVLVAVLVRLGDLGLSDGETMSILGKANAGEYALELHNPAGGGDTVLRFGVYVGGGYEYATMPASSLHTDRSHWIVAAYAGSGTVSMLVDHSSAAVTTGSAEGPIVANDAILQLGADPQDPDAPRYFLQGEVQAAIVQSWP